MARNGSGTYVKVGDNVVFDTVISETYYNNQINDIVSALTQSVSKDGQTTITGNINMGSKKLTAMAVGTAATDSLTLGQAQANAFGYVASDSGSSNAYVIAPSPAIAGYAAGQKFAFLAANVSSGASTLNVSGLGVKNVYYQNAAISGAMIKAGALILVVYDGTQFQMISPSDSIGSAASTTSAGIVELATDAETITGTDTARAVTPANIQAKVASTTAKGIVELATNAEAVTGSDTARAVTPAGVAAAIAGTPGGASAAEKANIMLNAFRISVNGGLSVQNMVDGVVDGFEDAAGVDTANSTNEVNGDSFYTAPGSVGLIAQNVGTPSTNFPTRTTAWNDGTTSQNSVAGTYAGGSDTYYVQKDYGAGAGKWITGWKSWSLSDDGYVTGADTLGITFQGSDNGTDWTNIQAELQASDSAGLAHDNSTGGLAAITNHGSWRYVRWSLRNVTGNNVAGVAEVEFYGAPMSTVDMTLISNAATALAAPTNVNLVIQQKDVESITLNSDLIAWVTREAGQTFTTDYGTDEKLDINGHGFLNDDRVMVTSASQDLPAGSDSATVYYVVNKTTNDFELSLTSGGSAINITDNGSGTHTARRWKQITLAEVVSLTTGRVLTGTVAVSGLTSGTAMRYALVTKNTKEQRIHAVALQWS